MLPLVQRASHSQSSPSSFTRSTRVENVIDRAKSSSQQHPSSTGIYWLLITLLLLLCTLQFYHLHSTRESTATLPIEYNSQLLSSPPIVPSAAKIDPAASKCDCSSSEATAAVATPSSCPPARQIQTRSSPALSHPSEIAPLFPSIYYVYDLDDLNSAILTNFTLAYPGKHPASFEHDDFRQHISEYFMARDAAKYSQIHQQYLCVPPSVEIPAEFARSRFTHDPRLATHFIIPALLSIALHSKFTHTDNVMSLLVASLSRPIRVVDPCNPTSAAVVDVPSPFLERHGRDHLLTIGKWDLNQAMGTKRKYWETPVTAAQIERAQMFEDCTFFNIESTFVNRLRLDFINFYKETSTPYDTRAHMTHSQIVIIPYTAHYLIESSLDPSAMWIDETIAERKHLFHAAESASPSTSSSAALPVSDSSLLYAYTFLSTVVSKSEKEWNERERQFVADLPTRPNLFTLRCTIFDKGHETRAELFKMIQQSPLNKFPSRMERMNPSKQGKAKIEQTRPNTYPAQDYVDSLLQADFCLIPAGDTPSSRRLYDAILTNCIPVVISDKFEFPYSSIVNWSSFTVRISQSTILSGDATPLIELSQWSNARKHSYRLALMRVRQHFDWNGAQKEFTQDVNQRAVTDIMAKPMQQVYDNLYHKEYRSIPQLHRFAATDMMLLEHQAHITKIETWKRKNQTKRRNN